VFPRATLTVIVERRAVGALVVVVVRAAPGGLNEMIQ
jgi:hypothetical protein